MQVPFFDTESFYDKIQLMPAGWEQLVNFYLRIVKYLNIDSFVIALITAGIAIWLSRQKGTRTTRVAILLNFVYPGLGQIYIGEYTIACIYILITVWLIGVSTPLIYVHYLFALSASFRYVGFKLFEVLFVWFHSMWYVSRTLQKRRRIDLHTAMYKEMYEIEREKKLRRNK